MGHLQFQHQYGNHYRHCAFLTVCKSPFKSVGAFDDLSRGQAENNVFGNDDSDSLHFDSVLADLLAKNQQRPGQHKRRK